MITYYNYPIPSLFPFIYFFSMERRKYYKHIKKAKDQPEKYLSVIIKYNGPKQNSASTLPV